MKQISKILNQNFLFILICCNCIIGKINSQTFYSKTYTRDSGFHYFSSLAAYDDCFYVLSHYSDPEVKNRYGATALLKFDWEGNILKLDSLPPKDGKSFAWPEDLQIIDDSLLFFVAQDTSLLFPIIYNRITRDFNIKEINPVINKYFYGYPKGIYYQDREKFMMPKNQTYRLKTNKGYKWLISDLVVYSLKSTKLDTIRIEESIFHHFPYCIKKNSKGNFYVGGLLTDFDYAGCLDYTFRQFIYEIDTNLQIVRKILSPAELKRGPANDIIEDSQKNIYCAGSDVIWHVDSFGGGNSYRNEIPAISKYNANGVYQWSRRLPLPDRSYDNYYNLIFSSDSNSLISVGTYFYSDSLYWDDSTYSSNFKGVITKINLEGDEQWTRLYSARGVGRQTSWSRFNDIVQSPSGGYLICGSNLLSYKQVVNEAGWLMKVDEFGCYIPGCHILSTVSDEEKIKLQLYPNPAHDHFAIIHNYEESLNCKMYTLDGVFVTKFDDIFPLETQIVDFDGLKSGEYLLQFFSQDGKWVGTKKLVVL